MQVLARNGRLPVAIPTEAAQHLLACSRQAQSVMEVVRVAAYQGHRVHLDHPGLQESLDDMASMGGMANRAVHRQTARKSKFLHAMHARPVIDIVGKASRKNVHHSPKYFLTVISYHID